MELDCRVTRPARAGLHPSGESPVNRAETKPTSNRTPLLSTGARGNRSLLQELLDQLLDLVILAGLLVLFQVVVAEARPLARAAEDEQARHRRDAELLVDQLLLVVEHQVR